MYQGKPPTLIDLVKNLKEQPEPEAQELAVQIELFTTGSHNTFAKQTNVNIKNRFVCFDILDLGSQMMPIGMLTVLDSIMNRTQLLDSLRNKSNRRAVTCFTCKRVTALLLFGIVKRVIRTPI